MRVILTTRDYMPFSFLIRLFTRRPSQKRKDVPSHMALEFYGSLLIEAIFFFGCRLNYKNKFYKQNRIIAKYEYKSDEDDFVFYRKAADKYHGQKYDMIGILWFAYYSIRYWLFKSPFPARNSWEKDDRAFCNEILSVVINEDVGNYDPNSIMEFLDADDRFERVTDEAN